jgi:hypothetical protein
VVTTTADSGPGSLRDAITQINADTSHTLYTSPSNSSLDEIDFNITGASDTGGGFNATTDVATIAPLSGLPPVTNAILIDGYTQTGASPNTHAMTDPNPGDNAVLKIVLNGSHATGNFGLMISVGNSTVRGLVVNGWASGLSVGGTGDVVAGNFLGTDVTGSQVVPNFNYGVVTQTTNGVIGGTTPDARNLISGSYNGIDLSAGSGTGNVIEGNLIGTNAGGTSALGNTYDGINNVFGPSDLLIGGTTPGSRNVISGNLHGIEGTCVIEGSYIGTDVTGTMAVGNQDGIWAGGGTLIGGSIPGAGNVISGNNGTGIRGFGNNIVIAGNLIGTDYTGTKALGNHSIGINFQDGGQNNVIGGLDTNAPGQPLAGGGNVISGNSLGIALSGASGASGNVIEGNYIGTDITGTAAVGNSNGVSLGGGATYNVIGGTTAAARNIISGNRNADLYNGEGSGIYISQQGIPGSVPSYNVVEGNYIGTDATGAYALGNSNGLWLRNSSNNTVSDNVVAASTYIGINAASPGNVVQGNLIGTNATGGTATGFGNGIGVNLGGSNNAVGGTTAGAGNLIAGNTGDGVLDGGSFNISNSILSNSIYANGGLGIDLSNGGNDNQAAPLLTGLSGSAASPAISGSLSSVANTTFRIEFFANPLPSNLANTEGQTLLGSVYVTTNATGKASFTGSGLTPLPATANYLTATATVATLSGTSYTFGDTSQFSSYLHVAYFFGGFQAPLSQALNFALNRVIPIKFTLTDLTGAAVTSLAAVSSLQIAPVNSDGSLGTPFTPASAGNTGLSVSSSTYSFNWATKGLTTGSYAIVLTLADGQVQIKVISLVKGGNSAGLTTMATGGTGWAPGGLLAGDIDLYIDNSNGDLTADELARIQDAVAAVDAVTEPYGVAVQEVTDPTLADVTLNMDTTSAVGGYVDGVLGCTTDAGQITIINGWDFYAGSDSTQIGGGQYDFETVVTHELGHALGLGHSTDGTSVMYATLNTGTVKRTLTTADLNVPDSDTTGACGLHAVVPQADRLPVSAAGANPGTPTAAVLSGPSASGIRDAAPASAAPWQVLGPGVGSSPSRSSVIAASQGPRLTSATAGVAADPPSSKLAALFATTSTDSGGDDPSPLPEAAEPSPEMPMEQPAGARSAPEPLSPELIGQVLVPASELLVAPVAEVPLLAGGVGSAGAVEALFSRQGADSPLLRVREADIRPITAAPTATEPSMAWAGVLAVLLSVEVPARKTDRRLAWLARKS